MITIGGAPPLSLLDHLSGVMVVVIDPFNTVELQQHIYNRFVARVQAPVTLAVHTRH